MSELETKIELETEDLSDEPSDEALDRVGERACIGCPCSHSGCAS